MLMRSDGFGGPVLPVSHDTSVQTTFADAFHEKHESYLVHPSTAAQGVNAAWSWGPSLGGNRERDHPFARCSRDPCPNTDSESGDTVTSLQCAAGNGAAPEQAPGEAQGSTDLLPRADLDLLSQAPVFCSASHPDQTYLPARAHTLPACSAEQNPRKGL